MRNGSRCPGRTTRRAGPTAARAPRPHRRPAHRRHRHPPAPRRPATDGRLLPGQSPARPRTLQRLPRRDATGRRRRRPPRTRRPARTCPPRPARRRLPHRPGHSLKPSAGQAAHHRVLGDISWPPSAMDRAAAEYGHVRAEAEQHGVAGERATAQAQRAFVLTFTDPQVADDEIDLAHQLLAGLSLRGTTLTAHIAALARDAGQRLRRRRARTGSAHRNQRSRPHLHPTRPRTRPVLPPRRPQRPEPAHRRDLPTASADPQRRLRLPPGHRLLHGRPPPPRPARPTGTVDRRRTTHPRPLAHPGHRPTRPAEQHALMVPGAAVTAR